MPSGHRKNDSTSASPQLIAGIGASAGGMEALKAMFLALPADSSISFIIVLHADMASDEPLPEVISAFASLPVQEIKNNTPVKPGHVYTASGHAIIGLKDGVFHVSDPCQPDERRSIINRFFYALAKDQGEKAVAIILSGTGSDGMLGLKEVSKAGGMTLVQAPATAQYVEMPQNAIDTGYADHVLSPVNLTEELLAYAEHMKMSENKEHFEAIRNQVDNFLPQICEILLQVTGHNFRHYKFSTLTRRIQRRIQVLRIESVLHYTERLKKDESEVHHLFNDLLIGVTAFFRDADAFETLAADIFPRMFKNRKPEESVRIWVPGCATGEEAYTLAILLTEYMEQASQHCEIQIFATDIDEEALATARMGIYSNSITDNVSPERLKRFFIKKNQHYHITKEIRALVLFSSHNLINDPPFSKLDLVSCRNLLIYLGSHLQKKLIPLFHYALKSGGYLFLGPSENLSSHRELFRPLNARHRISQRLPTAIRGTSFLMERSGTQGLAKPPNVASVNDTDTYLLMQRIVLDEFAPKSLVVDEEGQIICASGNMEKYLTVTAGAFHNNAMRLVREGLRVGLRTTLAEAVRIRRQVVNTGLSLRTPEGLQRIMLIVQPMPHMGDNSGLFMVVFREISLPLKQETAHISSNEEVGMLIEQLERELLTTREDLERTVQDLEVANEELKSSNEELLSMNEELQSANEELETSKEEVQAANDNLNRVNTDLENLLASTQIATIFLDNATHVRRSTPSVSAIYNLLPSDIGRPLSHFTHKARNMPPLPPAEDIQAWGKAIEHEIELEDGSSWYIRRLLPYRSQEGLTEGTLIMFTEITDRKRSELALRKSEERQRLALASSRLGVLTWNSADDMVSLSPRAAEIFGIPLQSVSWSRLKESVHPEDIRQVQDSIDYCLQNHTDYRIEYRITRPNDGKQVWVLSTGHGEYDHDGKVTGMTRMVQDITEKKTFENRLIESEKLYRAIGESIDFGIWVCNREGKNTYASPSFLKLLGMTQEECSEFGWGKALSPEDKQDTLAVWKKCVAEGWALWDREHIFTGTDGKPYPVLARGIPVKNAEGEVTSWVGINLDIRRIKEAEARLRASEQQFRKMADHAPVLIWISDTSKLYTWFNKPWLDFVGRPMERELGYGWLDNVHPEDIQYCCDIYTKAFDTQQEFRRDYRIKRYDGEYRWVADNGIPLYDADNHFTGYIGSCMDITEHKTAMEALKEADRRKDEFLATLAHELRNPLAPLSNGLQVIRRAANRPEIIHQTQTMMEQQVTHMVRLVDDLLDVSRITRGQIELQKQKLDIQTVIQNSLDLSRSAIELKKHRLDIILPDEPVHVTGDPIRLSQIIANLLNNSAKYTPEQGTIVLKVLCKGKKMVLSVKDNGIGIPADMLPKIFDVFVQVDNAMERTQGGLGIGLTLVRKLVELHGGTIEAKSNGIGKGSKFTITLPFS